MSRNKAAVATSEIGSRKHRNQAAKHKARLARSCKLRFEAALHALLAHGKKFQAHVEMNAKIYQNILPVLHALLTHQSSPQSKTPKSDRKQINKD